MLPEDPYMLLSVINMKLRDMDTDLDELCALYGCDREKIIQKLAGIGYRYSDRHRQFVPCDAQDA